MTLALTQPSSTIFKRAYDWILINIMSFFKTIRGQVRTRLMGFHKRVTCRKCPACRAPKCMKCINCLIPSNRQPCVKKICYFPRTPNCPDFD